MEIQGSRKQGFTSTAPTAHLALKKPRIVITNTLLRDLLSAGTRRVPAGAGLTLVRPDLSSQSVCSIQ